MFLLLILPILVSGFVVCNTNPSYFYKLHRYEGQYLYLKTAHLGSISLLIFTIIALLLNKFIPSSINIAEVEIPLNVVAGVKLLLVDVAYTKSDADLTSFTWVVLISVGAILVSYLWSALAYLRLWFLFGSIEKGKIILMRKALSDSPLDKLFFESFVHSKPLMITLECRKVYVGTISSLGEPNESEGMDQEISIIPIASGFRCKDELKVYLPVDYDLIQSDMNIVIRQEQVLTAVWFYDDVYKKLNERKSRITNSSS